MRGVISLAAAIALPLTLKGGSAFAQRNMIIFLSLSSRVACMIAVCVAWAGIIADPTTCHAQSPSEWTLATSQNAMKSDVHPAQDQIANPTHDNDPTEEKTACSHATEVGARGQVARKKASVANLAPVFLPFFNNGPVFGLPGTEGGDFRHRTQIEWSLVRNSNRSSSSRIFR
jgi:hypothetical protein